jgi:hypothetical protein
MGQRRARVSPSGAARYRADVIGVPRRGAAELVAVTYPLRPDDPMHRRGVRRAAVALRLAVRAGLDLARVVDFRVTGDGQVTVDWEDPASEPTWLALSPTA